MRSLITDRSWPGGYRAPEPSQPGFGGAANGVTAAWDADEAEDRPLTAAIGAMVTRAATLEYVVAVLVAITEGHRGQAAEHRALQLARNVGAAMTALGKLAEGPPGREDLKWLLRDAEAVLDDRNVVVHSIPLEDIGAVEEGGLLGWHPRTGEEIRLTTSAVLEHVEYFGITLRRFLVAIDAATFGADDWPAIS